MNGYNPMLDYQRNQLLAQQAMIQNQLNQMNHQQPQFNPYPQNNQPQFFVRQIGSIEEAKVFPVDPATMYFFLDTGTGKIYMKRLNTDNGKSEFYTYSLQETVEEKKNDPIEQINNRLSNIERFIGGLLDDKSISSNANNEKSNASTTTTDDGKVSATESTVVSTGSTNGKR